MNITGLLFLIITQILCGRGLIALFKIKLKPLAIFCLSMIIGTVLISFLPVILEVCKVPITAFSVAISISVLTILLNITQIKKYDYSIFKNIKIKKPPAYEAVFIVVFILLLIPGLWRSFYYPTYPRDILSGPEALAEFTVREGTIINSVFSIDLSSTNNHLKPPFVMDLQIIYKLLVYPFGKLWLVMISYSFVIWLYMLLKEKIHPLLVGVVMLYFICVPDLFAYMYVLLFDYCNMVFFFAGFYFLAQYAQTGLYKNFTFSAFLFAMATYIRLETIVLLGLATPLLIYFFHKHKMPVSKIIISLLILLGSSYLLYFLWIDVFIRNYMPVSFDVGNQLNVSLHNILSVYMEKLTIMTTKLVFGGMFAFVYGYFIYFFVIILSIDIIFFRRLTFNTEATIAIFGVLLVYFAMPLLGCLIPLFDIGNTTKRGIAKMLPLAALYLRNSGLLLTLSGRLRQFETGVPVSKTPATTGKKRKNR